MSDQSTDQSATGGSRLAKSESPYLRSAAHQPVSWYEWGEEAFAAARAESKPILLDVGAVWCHWCHVMDRESYENHDTAALINKFFIPVKVDRDERPDVDSRYQSAISAVSGQGGWPLTGFLTPDGRPFFGGTYFPPEDAMGRPGFPRILQAVADAYANRREELERAATALADAVLQSESFPGAQGNFDPAIIESTVQATTELFDARYGGFGRAPKFPHSLAIDLLLERYQATRDERILHIVERTLVNMACGGVYDQLAGGFHRYSVDERWLVPHFEKMSYDNSELLKNYVHAWQVTGKLFFREVAEGIIRWVNTTLSDQVHGGFYASQDADYSLDDDGDYFTWTLDELRAVLSLEEARIAELHFDVEANGEMHHNPAKNVLWVARGVPEIAAQLGPVESEIRSILAGACKKLLAARAARPTPTVDTTIYVGWNAMFASAYLEAARALGGTLGDQCRQFALKTLDRLLAGAWDDKRGFAHRLGGAWLPGTLDDHVFMALALLDAYEATLDRRYFAAAELAMMRVLDQHWDRESGGFFDRAADAPPMGGLNVRRKPLQDSPTPAGNPIAAMVLDRLYGYTGNALYRQRADATLGAFAAAAPKYGLFAASYSLAAVLHSRGPIEVVITGRPDDPTTQRLEHAAADSFRFGMSVLRITPETKSTAWLAPALAETLPHLRAEAAQAQVCMGTTCQPPVTDPEKLRALILGVSTGAASAR
ncbi:MAG TPA: thioredoxin domain-containing protein [Candidatus Acidoferrales bacterium]|nr:thioredoxin domain-containing protein [Candidatus Acidoferrales bacterium]